jgi:hypothetical protein
VDAPAPQDAGLGVDAPPAVDAGSQDAGDFDAYYYPDGVRG